MTDPLVRTGNPAFYKGMPSPNPKGKPKGMGPQKLNTKRRLFGKWHTHPVDKLVRVANFLEASNPEMCAKIWIRLLDACEEEERKNKGAMSPIVQDTATSAIPTPDDKLLDELENHGSGAITSSKNTSVETGEADLPVEASAESDLPGHPEE